VSGPSNSGEEIARAVAHVAICLSVAIPFAVVMAFAYTLTYSYTLDPSSHVVDKWSYGDLLKALRHWFPPFLLNGLISGAIVFWITRRKAAGVRRWAIVVGSCIGAVVAARLLPGQHFIPRTSVDYWLEAGGLAVASYLLICNSVDRPHAIGFVVAAGLGILFLAGEAGAENARFTSMVALVHSIDPTSPVCRESDQESGQSVIVWDPKHRRQLYRHTPSDDSIPYCIEQN
jgi:hypothetical protein